MPDPRDRPSLWRATIAVPLAALAGPLALLACSAARGAPIEPPARAPQPLASRPEVRVTRAIAVACPTRDLDGPMALADVDGDGHLDRVAVTRDAGGFTVHLHQAPSLRETRAFHVEGDRVEVAVTRRGQGPLGDLWIVALRDRPAAQVLFHLEHDQLDAIWRASGPRSAPSLRLDLDGDGRVDPIVGGASALRDGALDPIPGVRSARSIHGLPTAFGREEPVDLDGDGYPDVLAVEDGEARILALPGFHTTFSRAATTATILRYAGRPAIFVRTETGAEILAADADHTVLARLPELRYAAPFARLDPAGDGSVLALAASPSSALLSAVTPFGARPASLPVHHVLGLRTESGAASFVGDLRPRAGPYQIKLDLDLATPADPAVEQLGPVRVLVGGPPSLVGVRTVRRGSLSGFVNDGGAYELVVRAPPGLGQGRIIGRGSVTGEGGASAELLDLDGDGVHEILVRESDLHAAAGISVAEGTSRWILLRGDGHVLWRDRPRTVTTASGRFVDSRARARALDLLGDGTLALQLRSPDAEWYVLPEGSPLPDPLPPCLE
ncbi:MAG: VCBS repeat-containing protein [Byssovorax sp.]